jgi:hypothetical protein
MVEADLSDDWSDQSFQHHGAPGHAKRPFTLVHVLVACQAVQPSLTGRLGERENLYLGRTRVPAGRGGRTENGCSVNWAFVPSMLLLRRRVFDWHERSVDSRLDLTHYQLH